MKRTMLLNAILLLLFGTYLNAQKIGDKAPDYTVELLSGEDFKLSDHSGKVVLMFFFGNSCPYCVTSGPQVQGLYTKYKNDPDFIAIGLDTWNSSSNTSSVTSFQNSTGITFPLALKAGDVSSAYSHTYDRLVVIDQMGVIRHKGITAAVNDISNADAVISEYLSSATAVFDQSWSEGRVSVYPVPAREQVKLKLKLGGASELVLELSDMSGKTVLRELHDLSEGEQVLSIDRNDLETGIYLYKLVYSGGNASGRIIFQ